MNEPSRKETLEREALGYIQLGTLVQRRRSAERAEQVAQVLALNLPVDEKIRRIERIDAQPIPAGERRSAIRSPATVPESPSKKRMKESVIAAARHRARRKADIVPSTFMKYLLKEGREIRAKAKANAFIKAGFSSSPWRARRSGSFSSRRSGVSYPSFPPPSTWPSRMAGAFSARSSTTSSPPSCAW